MYHPTDAKEPPPPCSPLLPVPFLPLLGCVRPVASSRAPTEYMLCQAQTHRTTCLDPVSWNTVHCDLFRSPCRGPVAGSPEPFRSLFVLLSFGYRLGALHARGAPWLDRRFRTVWLRGDAYEYLLELGLQRLAGLLEHQIPPWPARRASTLRKLR